MRIVSKKFKTKIVKRTYNKKIMSFLIYLKQILMYFFNCDDEITSTYLVAKMQSNLPPISINWFILNIGRRWLYFLYFRRTEMLRKFKINYS